MKLFLVLAALAVSQVKVPAPDRAASPTTLAGSDAFVITEVVASPADVKPVDVKPIAPVKPTKVEVDPLPLPQPKIVTVADAAAGTCKAGDCANGKCGVAVACEAGGCGADGSCATEARGGTVRRVIQGVRGDRGDGPVRRLFQGRGGWRSGGGRLFGGRCGGGCG